MKRPAKSFDIPFFLVPIVIPLFYIFVTFPVLVFQVVRMMMCLPILMVIETIRGIVKTALRFERWFNRTYEIAGSEFENGGGDDDVT